MDWPMLRREGSSVAAPTVPAAAATVAWEADMETEACCAWPAPENPAAPAPEERGEAVEAVGEPRYALDFWLRMAKVMSLWDVGNWRGPGG